MAISPKEKGKAKRAVKGASVQPSGGNVFEDLGLSNPQERLAKADLASRICQIIAEKRLTQMKAAEIMGLDQPKISALKRGKLAGFSMSRLFQCLNNLGQEIEITIRPAPKAGHRADVRVLVACT
jgi:predicted XRE-type DNA-binding protein